VPAHPEAPIAPASDLGAAKHAEIEFGGTPEEAAALETANMISSLSGMGGRTLKGAALPTALGYPQYALQGALSSLFTLPSVVSMVNESMGRGYAAEQSAQGLANITSGMSEDEAQTAINNAMFALETSQDPNIAEPVMIEPQEEELASVLSTQQKAPKTLTSKLFSMATAPPTLAQLPHISSPASMGSLGEIDSGVPEMLPMSAVTFPELQPQPVGRTQERRHPVQSVYRELHPAHQQVNKAVGAKIPVLVAETVIKFFAAHSTKWVSLTILPTNPTSNTQSGLFQIIPYKGIKNGLNL
jgi:hypothetical protein